MQIKSFISDEIGFLERSVLERRLVEECEPFHKGVAFDCAEFGICTVTWVVGRGNVAQWYRPTTPGRRVKPKIAVKVALQDGPTGYFRNIWYFSLSKTGFLYPVAYEEQHKFGKGPWVVMEAYYSWRARPSRGVKEARRREAIPNDSVCREAERLFKLKSISKRRKHTCA